MEYYSSCLLYTSTILGTSRQPFKLMRVPDENGLDKVEAMKQTYYKPVSYTHLEKGENSAEVFLFSAFLSGTGLPAFSELLESSTVLSEI